MIAAVLLLLAAYKTWIKDSILTEQVNVRKLEFFDINAKNKDKKKLLEKHKTSFEKDQKKYDKLFEYEAKKVVQGVPRLSKEEAAMFEAMKAKPPASPPPGPPTESAVPCSVDMGSEWLTGFV